MADQELISILQGVKNAKRVYRDQATASVLRFPELIPTLVNKVFDHKDPLHIKAAWVLELVCLEEIALLDVSIHRFIQGMPVLSNESALRPVAKICSLWSKYYYSQKPEGIQLSKEEIEQIISCNFDWLIEKHKVATQVFAMDTLWEWGKDIEWVQRELVSLLQKNAESGSSGYRAHARKLLKNVQINDA